MAGSYLTNGVYLPEMSESPWGEQVNNNFVILSNDIDNVKIDYNTKLSGKLDRTSTTTQIINSNQRSIRHMMKRKHMQKNTSLTIVSKK